MQPFVEFPLSNCQGQCRDSVAVAEREREREREERERERPSPGWPKILCIKKRKKISNEYHETQFFFAHVHYFIVYKLEYNRGKHLKGL